MVIEDKVKLQCTCKRVFREKASRVRDGYQVNCPDCYRLLTLSKETQDPFMRRALREAREMRAAELDRKAAEIYKGTASAPPRETP